MRDVLESEGCSHDGGADADEGVDAVGRHGAIAGLGAERTLLDEDRSHIELGRTRRELGLSSCQNRWEKWSYLKGQNQWSKQSPSKKQRHSWG